MPRPAVAILGATSHIAKGLILRYHQERAWQLHLFTRRPDAIASFLEGAGIEVPDPSIQCHEGYSELSSVAFGTLINCVGTGTRRRLNGDYSRYFTVTEEFDNLAIETVRQRSAAAQYISISSGAVYGRGHLSPVDEASATVIPVNHVGSEDYYGIARLNAEAKHRSLERLNIIDLRIFSYFSRLIDLSDGYFITDLLTALLRRTPLVTSRENMIRDYLHPEDLFQMVRTCMGLRQTNTAFDVVSRQPVDKMSVLQHFSRLHGLEVDFLEQRPEESPTGFKSVYSSTSLAAARVGYAPRFTSLETLDQESRAILASARGGDACSTL